VIRKADEGFGVVEYAEPPGWEEMEAAEAKFETAEKVRLLYVAATRAKDLLVVSVWKQGKSDNAQGPWSTLAPHLAEDLAEPGPVPEAPAPEPLEGLGAELAAFRTEAGRRRAAASAPTTAVAAVTDLAHAGEKPAWESTGRGMSWGRVLHGALEAAMRSPRTDLSLHVANLLAEEERPPGELPEVLRIVEAVRGSDLWARALAGKRRLVEVPFAIPEGAGSALVGVVDLVFEEDGGWIVVDYKSDAITDANRAGLLDFYFPQIGHYRRSWEKLTGSPTRAALFFIATGETVWMPEDSTETSRPA
jgi:ATP-dependent helicase/nuclease subunit A